MQSQISMTIGQGAATPLPKVLVMMATYNGEQFVASQIDSILAQENVVVALLIHDDGSTDATLAICQQYAEKHDNVTVVANKTNQGIAHNFMGMLYEAGSDGFDLYAFSDQDDEWFPNKLATASQALLPYSAGERPALYFSDIRNEWVDAEDRCTRQEREISRFRGCEHAPMTLLVRNWVNGCAMVFNAPMRQLLLEYRPPAFPRIHDVWVHMVARYCGTIIADYDTVLMRRRITGGNAVGKTRMHISSFNELRSLIKLSLADHERPMHDCATLFMKGYGEYVLPQYVQPITTFLHYRESLSSRVRLMASKDYWLPSTSARLRMRLAMLLGFY